MTFTLGNCVERINQALDYPALVYEDISHYFDQAISELNSTLRIGLRPISQLVSENEFVLKGKPNVVILDSVPSGNIPTLETSGSKYYYNTDTDKYELIDANGDWNAYDFLYGVYNGTVNGTYSTQMFVTVAYGDNAAWGAFDWDRVNNLELTDYLPVDVIILFIIPYVCFKFTVRDGGNGAIFREEFIQGFQQIQTSYDIPNTVVLATVAGKKAYVQDVNEHADNLTVRIPLRAIYDSMKIGNAIMPEYGGFYENGGWGL